MKTNRFIIFFLNILGFFIFLSYYSSFGHEFWFFIDKKIFFYFNNLIINHSNIELIVSITNLRIFDFFIVLILLYLSFYSNKKKICYKRLIVLIINLLLVSIILDQIGHLIPIKHVSPTLFFNQKHNINNIAGMIVKNSSINSFPGDHGLLLMIFSCFIWRYSNFYCFLKVFCCVIIFTLPRIMLGAHWFTDIFVGSLSIVLIGMSWWLLTNNSDKFMNWIYLILFKKFFVLKK